MNHHSNLEPKDLPFRCQSVSDRLLVMSRPLPILERIASYNYCSGIFSILERTMPSRSYVPPALVGWVRESIPKGLSFSREVSLMINNMVSVYIEKMNAMNFAICFGFKIRYAFIPSLMIAFSYDIYSFLNPSVVNSFLFALLLYKRLYPFYKQ